MVIDKICRTEFEKALKTISKQAIEIKKLSSRLIKIENGLIQLKTRTDWSGVDEVDSFIDGLIDVCMDVD